MTTDGHGSTRNVLIGILSVAVLAAWPAAAAEKIEKLTFGSGGKNRTYYLFVPEKASAGNAPMIVLLHGSGRNGKSLVDPWVPLAKAEGIILAAPDALDPRGWRVPEDGPEVVYDLMEMLRVKYEVDSHRMFLFGHSAGAIQALQLAALESQYFAAVAVHAGALDPAFYPFLDRAPRKIPIAIWVGTNDALFPVAAVRATRDALNTRGFGAQLTEVAGHTHDYYGRASEINKQAWIFLHQHQLEQDPVYQHYTIER
jgi:poly(3-hydroxybutyrate) depolymerase